MQTLFILRKINTRSFWTKLTYIKSALHSFEDQTNSFFLTYGQVVYVSEKFPKASQDVIEDVIVREVIVSTEGNENLLMVLWHLRDPIMLVDSVEPRCLFTKFLSLYMNTRRKQKRTKHAFFASKRWTWYPTNNCSLMSYFNQPNIERKICCGQQGLKGYCKCLQHVELRRVFTF